MEYKVITDGAPNELWACGFYGDAGKAKADWLDYDTIHAATTRMCVAMQKQSQISADCAQMHLSDGSLEYAISEQRLAADQHADMWWRLERLIGVA